MDAFYAAVAIRDRPDLQDRAVIAGGGNHGVVLSATYPAREYGVRSAMPMTRARRLCPHAIVVQPDYDEVAQVSSAVMETFRSITPKVETLSMDEAFLDVSGSLRRFGSPTAIGEYLRVRIFDEQRDHLLGGDRRDHPAGQARLASGQAGRAVRRTPGRCGVVPPSPRRRGAVGSGGEDRRAAAPARAAHRRRPRAHPARGATPGAGSRSGQPAARAGLGTGRPCRSSRAAGRTRSPTAASGTARRSTATPTTPR